MNISMQKKHFHRIQHWKLRSELNNIYRKPSANIVLNGGLFKAFPWRSGTCHFNSLYQRLRAAQAKKGNKRCKLGKDKGFMCNMIFADDCIHMQSKRT